MPVCEPLLLGQESAYVQDCLRTNWISSRGKYIQEFESKFAAYCGCSYGVTTTNGTTALHLALASIGIGEGDEVVLPTFTMAACVLAILYTGATPVLVDSDPDTWNMDVSQLEARITPHTKAIMPVHIYGHPCDMSPILDVASKHSLWVVEDAAEAHSAEYKGKRVGGIGQLGCFSFYANKIITTGEGGMVVTNDPKIAQRARALKDLAHSPQRRFLHTEIGFNYRMTNLQAAIGLAQLERINELSEMRRRNASRYNSLLAGVPGIRLPVERAWARNVYWMYSVVIKDAFGASRDDLMARLTQRGIETRPMFIPMHQQPAFLQRGLFTGERYPVAEELSERGLNLPSSSGLGDAVHAVCSAIGEIAGGA
ncbi:MAG: DegT/DnrJ/EryC1/StrS family aminotransferase [Chloroflexi bacterium]|nr:DegT/DnrJ/EryC1/StrS family aminotransferase [Chloroflexota bacterium]